MFSILSATLLIWNFRYFSGQTKDTDGKVEFESGKTSISKAVDGAVKIFTIAVSEVSGCVLGLLFYV